MIAPDDGVRVTGAGLGVVESEADESDVCAVCDMSFPLSEASAESVDTVGALVTGAGLGVLSSVSVAEPEDADEAVSVPGVGVSDEPDEAVAPESEEDVVEPEVGGAVVDGAVVGCGAFVTGGGLHVVSDEPDELSDAEVIIVDPDEDATSVFDADELDSDGGAVGVDVVVGACVCGVLVTGGGLYVTSSAELEDSDD